MLQRYVTLRNIIAKVNHEDIDNLLIDPDEDDCVDGVCKTLADLHFATKKLQDPSLTIADARTLFDGVWWIFYRPSKHLLSNLFCVLTVNIYFSVKNK